jgi:soluble lytic murein transglycosylase
LLATCSSALLAQDAAKRPWDPPPDPWHAVVAWAAGPDTQRVLSVAAAELAIGRPARAQRLLDRYGPGVVDSVGLLALRGAVAASGGKATEAAALYLKAARRAGRQDAGVLYALAGRALERAELPDSAAWAYRAARLTLPEIAGWLALREARLTPDSSAAESLLVLAPPAALGQVLAVRAHLRLLVGDMSGAERLLAQAGQTGQAADLALARGDTLAARAFLAQALATGDTATTRQALALVAGSLAPRMASDWMAAARAAARLGDTGAAARFAQHAVAAGDSATPTLLALGDWLERAGRRPDALQTYAKAGSAGAFQRARVLARLGQRAAAVQALREFATRNPDDASAPAAVYLLADIIGGDSLLDQVAQRWPTSEYASRARTRLAEARLARRDTAAALRYYRDEITMRGPEATRSRYHVARLRLRRAADSARAVLTAVARDDSLGYYGLLARRELGLEPPHMPPPEDHPPAAAVQAALDELALLDAVGFAGEAQLLVSHLMNGALTDPDDLLDLAEGLFASGRAPEAIRLGWRAAARLTLNHPRVLRVVFPWPTRSLVEAEARTFRLDSYLVAGLIRQESGFAPAARSRAGATGYMQLMPTTAAALARQLKVPWSDQMALVVDANVHIGSAHLAGLLARYHGNVAPAVAAYNAGGTPVDRWLRRAGSKDPAAFVERIEFPETQGYVRAVLRNEALYRLLYPPSPGPDNP